MQRIPLIVQVAAQALDRMRSESYVGGSWPGVDVVRYRLHHHLVSGTRFQDVRVVEVYRVGGLRARHIVDPSRRYEGHLIAVELAEGARRIPSDSERAARRVIRIESNVENAFRDGQVAGCGGHRRGLILGDRLDGDVVLPSGHKTLKGSLRRARRFALSLHVQHTLDGVVRSYRYLVVGVDSSRIGGLPQYQERRLVPEPHDELSGRVGFWFFGFFFWDDGDGTMETGRNGLEM